MSTSSITMSAGGTLASAQWGGASTIAAWMWRITRKTSGLPRGDGRLVTTVTRAAELAREDIDAVAERDPAAKGDNDYIWSCYRTAKAVAAYRLAHALQTDFGEHCLGAVFAARTYCEWGKAIAGVDIHPSASIGHRFVMDHGVGTVIGESAQIGDDCYVVQGVILGARGIADNPNGKRHPTIGARCQVGAFARILGPVQIGDDCRIAPHAVVVDNVPSGTRVSVLNQLQITTGSGIAVLGVAPVGHGKLGIYGTGLSRVSLHLSTHEGAPLGRSSLALVSRSDSFLLCSVEESVPDDGCITLTNTTGTLARLTQLSALWRHLRVGAPTEAVS